MRFWSWLEASEDTQHRAVLVIDGVIDSGESWYEDAVTPAAFREELAAHSGDIMVEINSPGGDVFAGFEIYNMLIAHAGRVTVRVVGMAASAASVIAMAADAGQLIMAQASMMMIHNPWTFVQGDAEGLREQADVLDMIRDVLAEIYMRRFNGAREELIRLLDEETWLTPQRAHALGLCDTVETPEDAQSEGAVASAMLGRYAAMSRETMAGIRQRFGTGSVPAREGTPMAAEDAAKLLEEADALIAACLYNNRPNKKEE